jgi:hypothetical protein
VVSKVVCEHPQFRLDYELQSLETPRNVFGQREQVTEISSYSPRPLEI